MTKSFRAQTCRLKFVIAFLLACPAHATTNIPDGPGCPMAHCDAQMTDNLHTTVPDPVFERAIYYDPAHPGSGAGLGCSSNLTTVACAYYGADGSLDNLELFDGSGASLFRSGTLPRSVDPGLDNRASFSAPIVFNDGSVLAVDDQHLVYYFIENGAWTARFAALPSDAGVTVSPVMVTDNIVLLASHCASQTVSPVYGRSPPACGVMTYRVGSGGLALIDHAYLFDSRINNQKGNGFFETLNTPAVDPQGPTQNSQGHVRPRVYINASELCVKCGSLDLTTRRQGQLWAVDVDPDSGLLSACYGGIAPNTCTASSSFRVILNRDAFGTLQNEAIDFPGPSGSSPLLVKSDAGHARIYFDGVNRSRNLSNGSCPIPAPINGNTLQTATTGCFYGVVDNGTAIVASWADKFPNAIFGSAAALDPDGDLWIEPLVIGGSYTCSNTVNYAPAGTTPYRNCLIRVIPGTGSIISQIDMTLLVDGRTTCSSTTTCYAPSSAFTIGQGSGGFTLSTGVGALNTTSKADYFVKVTVPESGPVTVATWTVPVSEGTPEGQFPVVQFQSPDGVIHRSVVFTASHAVQPGNGGGPFFIGDP